MLRRVRRATHDIGAAAVEYAVLLALVALVAVGGVTYLGSSASASLSDSQSNISGTTSSTSASTSTTAAPTTTTTKPPTTTTTKPPTTTTTRCRGPRC